MKIDRKKIYNRCGFDQLECYELAIRLAKLNDDILIEEIKKIKVWHYGKCELGLWADVLDRLDAILADGVTKVGSWTLKLDQPGNEHLIGKIIAILEFTGHLIEHSIYRYLYGSWDHILALFGTSNMDILLALLGLFYNFSKRSNYFSRLDINNRKIVLERLDSIAESWGGKQLGFGLAECCNINYVPQSAGSMKFEFTLDTSKEDSPDINDMMSANRLKTARNQVNLKNLHIQKDSPSQLMETLIPTHRIINTSEQMSLFSRLRLCVYFGKPELRPKLIYTRMQALSILCYTNEVEDKCLSWDIVEELVDVLKLPGNNFLGIKACALRTLTAIIHCGKLPACWSILRNMTGMNSYHGHFPTLMRDWIKDLVAGTFKPHAGTVEQQFTTAILSFLYHLACTNEAPNTQGNLVITGLLDSMREIITWHTNETDFISYATRAVRVTDQIFLSFQPPATNNPNNAGIGSNNNSTNQQLTIEALVARLEYEVNICLNSPVDEFTQKNLALNTQRVGFIKSMLNLIKRLLVDSGWTETIQQAMDGSLPDILRNIFTNYTTKFNAQLCLFSMEVITIFAYSQPSNLSAIQDRQLTRDILSTLTDYRLPINRDFLVALPSLLTNLSINERGIREIKSSGIIPRYIETLTDHRYMSAMRNKRIREMMTPGDHHSISADHASAHHSSSSTPTAYQMSNAMNELARTKPSEFRPIIYDGIVKAFEKVTQIGQSHTAHLIVLTNPVQRTVKTTVYSASDPNNNPQAQLDDAYLMDYLCNCCKFLERFLSDQHTESSLKAKLYSETGIMTILKIFSMPALPYDFPVSAACQSLQKIFEYLLSWALDKQDALLIYRMFASLLQPIYHRLSLLQPQFHSVFLSDFVNRNDQEIPSSTVSTGVATPIVTSTRGDASSNNNGVCYLHDLVVLSSVFSIYDKFTDRLTGVLRKDVLTALKDGLLRYASFLPLLHWDGMVLMNLLFENEEACLEHLRLLCIYEKSGTTAMETGDSIMLDTPQQQQQQQCSSGLSTCQQLLINHPRSERIIKKMLLIIQKATTDIMELMVTINKFCCIKPEYNYVVRVRHNRPSGSIPTGEHKMALLDKITDYCLQMMHWKSPYTQIERSKLHTTSISHNPDLHIEEMKTKIVADMKYLHPMMLHSCLTIQKLLTGGDSTNKPFMGAFYSFQKGSCLRVFFQCINELMSSLEYIRYLDRTLVNEKSVQSLLEGFLVTTDRLIQMRRMKKDLQELQDPDVKDNFNLELYQRKMRAYMLEPVSKLFAFSSSNINLFTPQSQEALMNIIAFLTPYIFDRNLKSTTRSYYATTSKTASSNITGNVANEESSNIDGTLQEQLKFITELGFDFDDARRALEVNSNNADKAIQYLFNSGKEIGNADKAIQYLCNSDKEIDLEKMESSNQAIKHKMKVDFHVNLFSLHKDKGIDIFGRIVDILLLTGEIEDFLEKILSEGGCSFLLPSDHNYITALQQHISETTDNFIVSGGNIEHSSAGLHILTLLYNKIRFQLTSRFNIHGFVARLVNMTHHLVQSLRLSSKVIEGGVCIRTDIIKHLTQLWLILDQYHRTSQALRLRRDVIVEYRGAKNWFWMDERQGKWHSISTESNHINKCYREGLLRANFSNNNAAGVSYSVNFMTLTQKSLESSTTGIEHPVKLLPTTQTTTTSSSNNSETLTEYEARILDSIPRSLSREDKVQILADLLTFVSEIRDISSLCYWQCLQAACCLLIRMAHIEKQQDITNREDTGATDKDSEEDICSPVLHKIVPYLCTISHSDKQRSNLMTYIMILMRQEFESESFIRHTISKILDKSLLTSLDPASSVFPDHHYNHNHHHHQRRRLDLFCFIWDQMPFLCKSYRHTVDLMLEKLQLTQNNDSFTSYPVSKRDDAPAAHNYPELGSDQTEILKYILDNALCSYIDKNSMVWTELTKRPKSTTTTTNTINTTTTTISVSSNSSSSSSTLTGGTMTGGLNPEMFIQDNKLYDVTIIRNRLSCDKHPDPASYLQGSHYLQFLQELVLSCPPVASYLISQRIFNKPLPFFLINMYLSETAVLMPPKPGEYPVSLQLIHAFLITLPGSHEPIITEFIRNLRHRTLHSISAHTRNHYTLPLIRLLHDILLRLPPNIVRRIVVLLYKLGVPNLLCRLLATLDTGVSLTTQFIVFELLAVVELLTKIEKQFYVARKYTYLHKQRREAKKAKEKARQIIQTATASNSAPTSTTSTAHMDTTDTSTGSMQPLEPIFPPVSNHDQMQIDQDTNITSGMEFTGVPTSLATSANNNPGSVFYVDINAWSRNRSNTAGTGTATDNITTNSSGLNTANTIGRSGVGEMIEGVMDDVEEDEEEEHDEGITRRNVTAGSAAGGGGGNVGDVEIVQELVDEIMDMQEEEEDEDDDEDEDDRQLDHHRRIRRDGRVRMVLGDGDHEEQLFLVEHGDDDGEDDDEDDDDEDDDNDDDDDDDEDNAGGVRRSGNVRRIIVGGGGDNTEYETDYEYVEDLMEEDEDDDDDDHDNEEDDDDDDDDDNQLGGGGANAVNASSSSGVGAAAGAVVVGGDDGEGSAGSQDGGDSQLLDPQQSVSDDTGASLLLEIGTPRSNNAAPPILPAIPIAEPSEPTPTNQMGEPMNLTTTTNTNSTSSNSAGSNSQNNMDSVILVYPYGQSNPLLVTEQQQTTTTAQGTAQSSLQQTIPRVSGTTTAASSTSNQQQPSISTTACVAEPTPSAPIDLAGISINSSTPNIQISNSNNIASLFPPSTTAVNNSGGGGGSRLIRLSVSNNLISSNAHSRFGLNPVSNNNNTHYNIFRNLFNLGTGNTSTNNNTVSSNSNSVRAAFGVSGSGAAPASINNTSLASTGNNSGAAGLNNMLMSVVGLIPTMNNASWSGNTSTSTGQGAGSNAATAAAAAVGAATNTNTASTSNLYELDEDDNDIDDDDVSGAVDNDESGGEVRYRTRDHHNRSVVDSLEADREIMSMLLGQLAATPSAWTVLGMDRFNPGPAGTNVGWGIGGLRTRGVPGNISQEIPLITNIRRWIVLSTLLYGSEVTDYVMLARSRLYHDVMRVAATTTTTANTPASATNTTTTITQQRQHDHMPPSPESTMISPSYNPAVPEGATNQHTSPSLLMEPEQSMDHDEAVQEDNETSAISEAVPESIVLDTDDSNTPAGAANIGDESVVAGTQQSTPPPPLPPASEGGVSAAAATAVVTTDDIENMTVEQMMAEGIDPSFLEALPPAMRREVIQDHRRATRVRREITATELPASVDADTMAELPTNIQEEILSHYRRNAEQQQQQQEAQNTVRGATAETNIINSSINNQDSLSAAGAGARVATESSGVVILTPPPTNVGATAGASAGAGAQLTADPQQSSNFLLSLPESLRREVLADMDTSQLSLLSHDLADEARQLRQDAEERQVRALQADIISLATTTTTSGGGGTVVGANTHGGGARRRHRGSMRMNLAASGLSDLLHQVQSRSSRWSNLGVDNYALPFSYLLVPQQQQHQGNSSSNRSGGGGGGGGNNSGAITASSTAGIKALEIMPPLVSADSLTTLLALLMTTAAAGPLSSSTQQSKQQLEKVSHILQQLASQSQVRDWLCRTIINILLFVSVRPHDKIKKASIDEMFKSALTPTKPSSSSASGGGATVSSGNVPDSPTTSEASVAHTPHDSCPDLSMASITAATTGDRNNSNQQQQQESVGYYTSSSDDYPSSHLSVQPPFNRSLFYSTFQRGFALSDQVFMLHKHKSSPNATHTTTSVSIHGSVVTPVAKALIDLLSGISATNLKDFYPTAPPQLSSTSSAASSSSEMLDSNYNSDPNDEHHLHIHTSSKLVITPPTTNFWTNIAWYMSQRALSLEESCHDVGLDVGITESPGALVTSRRKGRGVAAGNGAPDDKFSSLLGLIRLPLLQTNESMLEKLLTILNTILKAYYKSVNSNTNNSSSNSSRSNNPTLNTEPALGATVSGTTEDNAATVAPAQAAEQELFSTEESQPQNTSSTSSNNNEKHRHKEEEKAGETVKLQRIDTSVLKQLICILCCGDPEEKHQIDPDNPQARPCSIGVMSPQPTDKCRMYAERLLVDLAKGNPQTSLETQDLLQRAVHTICGRLTHHLQNIKSEAEAANRASFREQEDDQATVVKMEVEESVSTSVTGGSSSASSIMPPPPIPGTLVASSSSTPSSVAVFNSFTRRRAGNNTVTTSNTNNILDFLGTDPDSNLLMSMDQEQDIDDDDDPYPSHHQNPNSLLYTSHRNHYIFHRRRNSDAHNSGGGGGTSLASGGGSSLPSMTQQLSTLPGTVVPATLPSLRLFTDPVTLIRDHLDLLDLLSVLYKIGRNDTSTCTNPLQAFQANQNKDSAACHLWSALSDTLTLLVQMKYNQKTRTNSDYILLLQSLVETFLLCHSVDNEVSNVKSSEEETAVKKQHQEELQMQFIVAPEGKELPEGVTKEQRDDHERRLQAFFQRTPPPPQHPASLYSTTDTQQALHLFTHKHRSVINQILRRRSVSSLQHTLDNCHFWRCLLSNNSATTSSNGSHSAATLLDFDIKRRYFHAKLAQLRREVVETRYDEELIQVSRQRLFEDSYGRLHRKTPDEWKQRFSIKFTGEEGQDGGGLLREWYLKMSHEIFNPDYALFKISPDGVTYTINPASYINSNHLSYFKFVGRFIAKAIFDQKLLQCYFTRAIYKHILGLDIRYVDLENEDYQFFQGLEFLLENDISSTFGLSDQTFTVHINEFGHSDYRELISGGAQVHVTEANKREYVKLVCTEKMNGAIRQQLTAMMEGFYDIIPKSLISIFQEKELELLISGLPDIDIQDLRRNTVYTKYHSNSDQIKWFWRALESFDSEDKARFIQFVTGTSKVPLGGFSKLEGMNGPTKFQISLSSTSTSHLPAAHTCFNSLDLPPYESYEKLRERLLMAIRECSEGYGMI